MAHIRKYTKADGTVKYRAEIVICKDGMTIHRESKAFLKQKLAKDWALRRELEIQEKSIYGKRDSLPVGKVIERYIKEFKPSGRSKNADLTQLLKRDIAKFNVHTLTAKDLIKHTRERNEECKPQTAANDLIWLNTVIKTLRGVIDIDCDMSIFETAREILRNEGLIAKSAQRDRRPTREELWKLSRHFSGSPMLHIMWFAIDSARRLSEITRLEWADNDDNYATGLVREAKHPRLKAGNHRRFKYPRSAWKIVNRQSVSSEFIFPYNPRIIGTNFDRACKMLGIIDLHFHDLRHEATSRLFERKHGIVEVQQVTLHESWKTLQRYVNLNPGDVDI